MKTNDVQVRQDGCFIKKVSNAAGERIPGHVARPYIEASSSLGLQEQRAYVPQGVERAAKSRAKRSAPAGIAGRECMCTVVEG